MSTDTPTFPGARGELIVTGLNHRSASIDIRERFALPDEQKREVLSRLRKLPAVREAVVVSTCNRVELILASNEPGVQPLAEEVFANVSGVSSAQFRDSMYHLSDRAAIAHVFRVAAGLDSLVLGEPQILGQVKSAYELARQEGSAGSMLHRLFHRAFHVAKVVRTNTGIGQQAVSVCYAAKELAVRIFGELSESSVMLVGAGETGALAAKHFARAGVKEFFVVNKSLPRACELAETYGGVPLSFTTMRGYLARADILIGASQLPLGAEALVGIDEASRAARARLGKPQFYIDLGVPRNFDPLIGELPDTFLYNVDDLEHVVKENRAGRLAEASRAEVLVEEEVDRFSRWLQRREIESTIRDLQMYLREVEELEVKRTIRRLSRLQGECTDSAELERALHDFAQSLLAKTLHRPLSSLRASAESEQGLFAAFQALFGPESDEE